MEYDQKGNLLSRTEPDGGQTTYAYNFRNWPERETRTGTNAAGETVSYETTYGYDKVGNQTLVTWSSSYDAQNRLTSTVDPTGAMTAYKYDKLDRQIKVTDGKTYATNYAYDQMNRLEGTTYASGREITQTWNNLGQLEGITDYASDFTFNGVGYLQSYRPGNGVTANYDFTDNGLLKSLSYNDTAGIDTLLGYAYSYDNAGNMTARNSDAYGYDVKNQLIVASIEGDSLAVEEQEPYAQAKYATEDILGQEEAEEVTETVILDTSASSLVIDYTYPKRISKVIVTPDDPTHRITAETLAVYTSLYNNSGYYEEVEDAEITIEETTGIITVEFNSPVFGRYMKLHSHHNELNADGTAQTGTGTFSIIGAENITAYAKVGGRNEFYIYDGKGNRTSKSIMSDATYNYPSTYYDNSDLLKTNEEGTFTYRYDANGNLVEKGTAFVDYGTDVNILTLSELTEAPKADYNNY